MKLSRYILPFCALLATACSSGSATSDTAEATLADSNSLEKRMSVWMAESDMARNPEGWTIDFQKKPKWEYTHGLMMLAHQKIAEQAGQDKFFDYAKDFADFMISEDGTIKTYKKTDYNIDRVNPGKFLINLYKETGEEKYRLAIEELRDQMRHHPRTTEGGFWHKKVYPHQMWLDGLYMGSPFLAKYAVEFDEPALFDDVVNQFRLINKYTWDEQEKVFYHGWDESREQKWADPQTGLSPHAWGRAMGWLSMALVDVLDYIPEEHPGRAEVLKVVQNMAVAIETHQDAESGVWWQVLNLGGREGNYLEASASSMFTYFLLKASKKGYIDQRYMQVAQRGYKGILENFIKENKDGSVSLTQVCAVAGLGGDPYRDASYEYYINEPRRDNDPKGVGPFIMASLEIEALNNAGVN
jgi:unsaturated rhamnogalacturonyl hydrolase